jgi:hypothetical protein
MATDLSTSDFKGLKKCLSAEMDGWADEKEVGNVGGEQ